MQLRLNVEQQIGRCLFLFWSNDPLAGDTLQNCVLRVVLVQGGTADKPFAARNFEGQVLALLDFHPRHFQRRQKAVKIFAVGERGVDDLLQLFPNSGQLFAQPCAIAAPAWVWIFNDRQAIFPAQQVGDFSDSE